MTGQEMLIMQVLKMLKLDPAVIQAQVKDTMTNVHTVSSGVVTIAQLCQTISQNTAVVMASLETTNAKLDLLLSVAKDDNGSPLIKPTLEPLSEEEQAKLLNSPQE